MRIVQSHVAICIAVYIKNCGFARLETSIVSSSILCCAGLEEEGKETNISYLLLFHIDLIQWRNVLYDYPEHKKERIGKREKRK